jgi:hypothetical protein
VNARPVPHPVVHKPARFLVAPRLRANCAVACMMQVLFGFQEPSISQTSTNKRDAWQVLPSKEGKACDPHSGIARRAR